MLPHRCYGRGTKDADCPIAGKSTEPAIRLVSAAAWDARTGRVLMSTRFSLQSGENVLGPELVGHPSDVLNTTGILERCEPLCVLGSKAGSFGRAASVLNH